MATRLRIALIAVVIVLVAYTGASWIIGIKIQSRLEASEQDALKRAPYLVQVNHLYTRGLFTSTEESTYGFSGSLARLNVPGSGPGSTGAPPQLTIRNNIAHGPLPRLRSIGLATIDSEVVLPQRAALMLDAVLGTHPTVSVRTTLGWLGGSRTQMSVPAFQAQLPGGATVSWRGLTGTGEMGKSGEWAAELDSDGLSARNALSSLEVGEIHIDGHMQPAFGSMNVGNARLTLASLEARTANGGTTLVKGLSISSASQVDGEFVNSEVRLAADQVSGAKFSFSHVVYGMRVLHLEGTALAGLTQAVRQAQMNAAGPGGAAAAQAAIRDAMTRYGADLLVHDPAIEIQSLAFAMPEGEFHLAASLAAHGIRREDLTGGAVGLIALTRYLDGALELRIDDALLARIIASSPQGPTLSARLDTLEKQGFLRRDGSAWTAQIAYHAGRLTINGQPYPPAAGL